MLFSLGSAGEKLGGACVPPQRRGFSGPSSATAHRKRSAGRPCRPGPYPPGLPFCTSPAGSRPRGDLEAAPAQWPPWVRTARKSASKEKTEATSDGSAKLIASPDDHPTAVGTSRQCGRNLGSESNVRSSYRGPKRGVLRGQSMQPEPRGRGRCLCT